VITTGYKTLATVGTYTTTTSGTDVVVTCSTVTALVTIGVDGAWLFTLTVGRATALVFETVPAVDIAAVLVKITRLLTTGTTLTTHAVFT